MAYILHIETSTKQCSVAIGYKGKCISEKKLLSQNYSHEEKLHVFIKKALEEVKLNISELGAVSVSKGQDHLQDSVLELQLQKEFVLLLIYH